jgi:hypothetical protein
MTQEQLHQVDESIQRILAETMRLGLDVERERLSVIDAPWFPWVAMPCAVALGVMSQ